MRGNELHRHAVQCPVIWGTSAEAGKCSSGIFSLFLSSANYLHHLRASGGTRAEALPLGCGVSSEDNWLRARSRIQAGGDGGRSRPQARAPRRDAVAPCAQPPRNPAPASLLAAAASDPGPKRMTAAGGRSPGARRRREAAAPGARQRRTCSRPSADGPPRVGERISRRRQASPHWRA